MALIKPPKKVTIKTLRVSLTEELVQRAQRYVEFAGLDNIDQFFDGAATLVFSKDKEFQKLLQEEARAAKEAAKQAKEDSGSD